MVYNNRNKIRGMMAERRMTIRGMANETGLSEATISNYLKGGNPGFKLIMAFKKALKLEPPEIVELFFDNDLPKKEKHYPAEGK